MIQRFALLLGLVVAFAPTAIWAAETSAVPLAPIGFAGSQAGLTVFSAEPGLTSISLDSPAILMTDQTVDYEVYRQFSVPGEGMVYAEGNPSVPRVTRFYRIPNTGGVELVVTEADYDLVNDVDALPMMLEEPPFGRTAKNDAVYSSDSWYPPVVAEMSEPMVMRDFRVVIVSLHPVQVNPVTRQARIYRRLSADVVATGGNGTNEITSMRRPSGAYAPMYRAMIANLDEHALDDATTTPGSYLILCHSNAQAREWADSLALWKTRCGYRVMIDARLNWSTSAMETAIRQAYTNWDPPLEFVTIVGDPDWTYGLDTKSGIWDHDFGRANTSDEIEDIAVGRLCGDAGEMAVINAKIMAYERDPYMTDTTWFHRAYCLAGISQGVASNYTLMQWGRQQFRNFTGINDITVNTHNGSVSTAQVTPYINAGVSIFLWRGGWISEMSCNIPQNTSPGRRLPISLTITCSTGDFEQGTDCLSECWLVSGTVSNPKGGVCGIGTATPSTHPPQNITLAGGLVYNIANLGVEHIGTALVGAKYWLFLTFGPNDGDYSGPYARQFSRYCNLLGDPGLSIWTDVPEVMDVTHPTALGVGAREVSVTVELASGEPVEDAVVTVWKRGADSTYARGLTDAQGHVVLPVRINSAGEAWLTVTKHNHKPYLFSIPCASTDALPMLSSYTVDDDNSGGTHGNGDGVVNPGEIVDLPIYLRNFGTTTPVTGLSATLACTNPRAAISGGTAAYPDLMPGDSALGSAPFRIVFSSLLQNEEAVLLTLTVTGSTGQTEGAISLQCAAGEPAYVSQNSAPFDPGGTRSLVVTLQNRGATTMNGVAGFLQSLSPFVQVDDGDAVFGDIAVGQSVSNASDAFALSSNSLTFRGHVAPMILFTTTTDGQLDTVQFTVKVGTATSVDPTGPDAYGYHAYDNTDANYEMHPEFSYVNISSGLGTNLNLNDTGEKTSISQLWSTARALPFPFTFYGHRYDSVTVCANGWLAFGNQSWNDNFRNYPIPAMQAPDAMIAPYWDDLRTSGTGLGVWHYHDAANHRYIVQWKATGAFNSTPLDFEVILYDTVEYPTLDGNGLVLVQYNTVQMNFAGNDNEPDGCTIGIQAPGGLVGLPYAYQTSYSPGAATVSSGRAVLYTTNARMLFGCVAGHVTDYETGLPIPGALVSIEGFGYHATAGTDGEYEIDNVLIGTYTLRASAHRYNIGTVEDVLVELDSTETVDFVMLHPEMLISADSIVAEARGQPVGQQFSIFNEGNGPLDYSITVHYSGDEDPNPWDSVAGLQVTQLTGDYQILGCEFAGDYWWVTGGGGPGGQNMIYKFDLAGNPAGSIPQPSTSGVGWFDLAWDGQYLYGSDSHEIVGIDTFGNVRATIPSPMNPTRAIAYDPASDHFWVTDYTQDIFELDRNGNIIRQVPNTGSNELAVTGLAWNATDPDGYKLYIFSQNGASTLLRVSRMHPPSQLRETVIDLGGQPGDRSAGCTITPAWNSTLLVFGGIIQNATGDRLQIYEMAFNTTWIAVTPAALTIPAGTQREISVLMDPTSLRPNVYRVNLRIASTVLDTTVVLPVRLTVISLSVTPREDLGAPDDYALYPNYPNPFNPSTVIRYDLKRTGHTRLAVYNLLGERVAELVNAQQSAGHYEVTFDARDLPSGMYFYRLDSGEFSQAAKMILMK